MEGEPFDYIYHKIYVFILKYFMKKHKDLICSII